jgi:BASS family bile acid:Na+ symporter
VVEESRHNENEQQQNAEAALPRHTVGPQLCKIAFAPFFPLHTVGFGVGYLASKKLFGLSERVSRTISIETGMQNSALAVVLARSVVGSDPALASITSLACLPGAFSATVHSCLGSALAVYWRWVDRRRVRKSQV